MEFEPNQIPPLRCGMTNIWKELNLCTNRDCSAAEIDVLDLVDVLAEEAGAEALELFDGIRGEEFAGGGVAAGERSGHETGGDAPCRGGG